MESHIILDQENERKREYIGNNLDDFEFIKILNKKHYGLVAKVKSKINQKIYAMKMKVFSLIKDKAKIELSINEIKILQSLDSPHIIKCYNHFKIGNIYIKLFYSNYFIRNKNIK